MTKKRKVTPNILHDWPLRNDDEALFNFDDFAITLARLAADRRTPTPLTIGISGPWGSGKTTLLRRIKRLLDETTVLYDHSKPDLMEIAASGETPEKVFRPCRTVWFNAWKYNDEDALLVALIRRILQEMAADDWFSKAAAKVFDPTYPRRDVVNTVLGWFSLKLGDAGLQLSTGTPQQPPLAQKTAILDLFDEAFDRLLAAWVHRDPLARRIDPKNGLLVVFIDDLDRCLPSKMIQVLEAVKLFLDKEGCVFYLGADADVLQQAVAKQYAQAGVSEGEARDYLGKIIQLRFHLPPATPDTMQDLIRAYPAAEEALGDTWRLLVTGAALNPRKVKTFVNDLNLAWAMLQSSGKEEGFTRQDFNTWQVLLRVAPAAFVHRVRERLDDPALRFKFVQEALRWAREAWEDDEDRDRLNRQFGEYDDWRFRRVLRDAVFTEAFNAEMLDALVHLSALPQPAAGEAAAAGEEAKPPRITGGARRGTGKGMAEGKAARGLTFAGMPFVRVPKGPFLMGSTEDNVLAESNECPQHTLNLDYDYYIGRFPVTNADFARFKPEHEFPKDKEKHPVVYVSWYNALAYIRWLNETFAVDLPEGYRFALPSEAEWEKAARDEFGNEWPWGNEWREGLCNSGEAGIGDTTPVGQFSPQGDSPYGCADMSGNVWEWTRSLFKEYPYDPQDGRENLEAPGDMARVLRGGSFFSGRGGARAAVRLWYDPLNGLWDGGFRVVVAPMHSGL
ncbi:MAG TPA: hypothetical protein ENJ54_07205 [Chloroflexi bacterium]|nr:hypothetical protein [Chloroflexota bacterium]